MAAEPIKVFSFEQVENTLVVMAHGDLFQHRFEDLRNGYNDTYRKLSEEGVDNLVIDFKEVEHFGSAFIGMLIKLAQKARLGGGQAMLCSLSDSMVEVLKSLMLLENVNSDFFMVPQPNRESAMKALGHA